MMDILYYGIIVADCRLSRNNQSKTKKPIEIVSSPFELRIGGISIAAIVSKSLDDNCGVIGRVGEDFAGYGIKAWLRSKNINEDGIRFCKSSTSSSLITITDEDRFIKHSTGANAELYPDKEDIGIIVKNSPGIFAVGYAGLIPRMDADGGKGYADIFSKCRKLGILTALDTHTCPPYKMLERAIPVVDFFVCNKDEAGALSGSGTDYLNAGQVVRNISDRFPRKFNSSRIIGATYKEGSCFIYQYMGNTELYVCDNPYSINKPHDLTGAGDAFRAGMYHYLIRNTDAFKAGKLNIIEMASQAHYTATCYLNANCEVILKQEH
jgi:sugar/nucleoside kinase (ribokinase family)